MILNRGSGELVAWCAAVLFAFGAVSPAHAGLVKTDDVLVEVEQNSKRAHVIDMLERDAVRAQLEAMGVAPEAARARVARMTDAEVAELHGRIEDKRAGGIHHVALTVFIVFVITDAVGATDIFPFIEPVD
jgi:hypothetical protein